MRCAAIVQSRVIRATATAIDIRDKVVVTMGVMRIRIEVRQSRVGINVKTEDRAATIRTITGVQTRNRSNRRSRTSAPP